MARRKIDVNLKSLPVGIKNCTQCSLSRTRQNVVLGRGNIPATVLFMGEAPGETEDLLGTPFIGKSGRLFKLMLQDANNDSEYSIPKYFITNTVLCRPVAYNENKKSYMNRQPTIHEVLKCKRNVFSIIKTVRPKIICFIGKEAEKYYLKDLKNLRCYEIMKIQHPSFLLRTGAQSSPYYGTNIRYLTELFKKASKYGN